MTGKNNIVFILIFVALGIAFLSLSYINFRVLQKNIETHPQLQVENYIKTQNEFAIKNGQRSLNNEIGLHAILEGHVIQRRYHQANSLLIGKIWINYLGFLTGMILSLMGGFFVLGKFKEPEISSTVEPLSTDIASVKMKVATSSPGLFLTLMGTILMISTILSKDRIDVEDKPTYLHSIITKTNPESNDTTSNNNDENFQNPK